MVKDKLNIIKVKINRITKKNKKMEKTDYQKFKEKWHKILNVSRFTINKNIRIKITFIDIDDKEYKIATFNDKGILIDCCLMISKVTKKINFPKENKALELNKLRDEFAMRAMQVFISDRGSNDYIAKESYEIANAMLKEREKHLSTQDEKPQFPEDRITSK